MNRQEAADILFYIRDKAEEAAEKFKSAPDANCNQISGLHHRIDSLVRQLQDKQDELARSSTKLSDAWADLRKARQRISELEGDVKDREIVGASWFRVCEAMQEVAPTGLQGPGKPSENAVEWIKQSARLRELFNQGLAVTTAK